MNFYVYINGKTHKLVQGFTINEEYNETLDSASIIISDSPQLEINPYDDVFIYSEYCGVYDVDKDKIVPNYQQKFVFKGYPINSDLYASGEMPFFYKHFLIFKFVEKIIILGENESNTRYEYTIELFSETKGLETVPAPNISITQPLNSKISTVTYTNRFLSLYNKRIKKTLGGISAWSYYSKYTLGDINKNKYLGIEEISENGSIAFSGEEDNVMYALVNFTGELDNLSQIPSSVVNNLKYKIPNATYYWRTDVDNSVYITGTCDKAYICYNSYIVKTLLTNVSDIFGKSYTPDFTLNNPSLRQILEKLFITKDCIPVVYDDQIYAMDITLRRGRFDLKKGQINYITGSKDSENYCTDLKRTYSNALTQENSSRYVEFLGFRNSNSGLLTLNNLRIETRFPIYKINKIYMCYFKKILYYNEGNPAEEKVFLCKQNITPLVKLNSERNVLSEDIEEFSDLESDSEIQEIAKYKLATVGYDIGSNYIDGWGVKYSYPTHNFFWQTEEKSYIENMFNYVNNKYEYGIYKFDYLIKRIAGDNIPNNFTFSTYTDINNSIEIPPESYYNNSDNWLAEKVNENLSSLNITLHLKHLFFEIDYNGFYNGTVIHSKGLGKDNLTMNDNPSSSLTLLELDGLAQKEKLDRYGNKGIQINARYKDINDVQLLGSVYEHNKDKDVVIYHKEYSINDNVIDCFYSGTKDYVLKDYFTSVYAKHRTYNLMSYGESITRSENQKMYFLISKNKIITDKNLGISFNEFDTNFVQKFFTFYNGVKEIDAYHRVNESEKENYGFFYKNTSNGKEIYSADINVFISGVSLCLNIAMYDNVSSGVYISKMKTNYVFGSTNEKVTGSTQQWLMLVDDINTGQINTIGFGFAHIQTGNEYGYIDEDTVYDYDNFDITGMYDKILKLPKIIESPNLKNEISFEKNIYKDNKEKIDMTFQIEPLVDKNIYISPWVSKLSDLFSVYEKYNKNITYKIENKTLLFDDIAAYTVNYKIVQDGPEDPGHYESTSPMLIIGLNKNTEDWLQKYPPQFTGGLELDQCIVTLLNGSGSSAYAVYTRFEVQIKNIISVSSDNIKIVCDIPWATANGVTSTYYGEELTLNKITNSSILNAYYDSTGTSSSTVNVYGYTLFTSSFNDHYYYKNGYWPQWGVNTYQIFDKNQLIGYDYKEADETKLKNLFWVYTSADYEFKEYMVYDELNDLNDFSPLNVWENGDPITNHDIQFTWTSSNKLEIIHPSLDYGSHILCYYRTDDGKYNFVFGFKPDESSSGSGHTNWYTELNISLLSFKDLTVYDANSNLPVGEVPTDDSTPII